MRKHSSTRFNYLVLLATAIFANTIVWSQRYVRPADINNRQHISMNEDWHFYKYDTVSKVDNFQYDVRPAIDNNVEQRVADAKPTEAVKVEATQEILKPWILPSGNRFIKDSKNRHVRPEETRVVTFSM